MEKWKEFMAEEDGVGVVEVILILVVLIGLVLIFKDQLTVYSRPLRQSPREYENKGSKKRRQHDNICFTGHAAGGFGTFYLIRSGAFSGIGCKGGYECDAVGRVGVCGISERDLGSV